MAIGSQHGVRSCRGRDADKPCLLLPTFSLQTLCLPSDIIFHPWKKEENGNQSRVILYTITLTNPLAPKTATVRETQVGREKMESNESVLGNPVAS